jgi:hypothetical protein
MNPSSWNRSESKWHPPLLGSRIVLEDFERSSGSRSRLGRLARHARGTEADWVDRVRTATGGNRVDIVLESVGPTTRFASMELEANVAERAVATRTGEPASGARFLYRRRPF